MVNKKYLIKTERTSISGYELEGKIIESIKYLESLIEKYGPDVEMDIGIEDDFYGCGCGSSGSTSIKIIYKRQETDKERDLRLRKAETRRKREKKVKETKDVKEKEKLRELIKKHGIPDE